jgi:putative FmdB family regulatory protein
MPMYDFECKACGATFETVARVDEKPACPTCQSADTERLMSAPMIGGKPVSMSYKLPPEHRKAGPKK